jgi:hypothetical protein
MSAYKTLKMGVVLDRVFRARGMDPDQVTMTTKERARYGEQITRWCRKAWEKANWPQLFKYEQRTYRPPWADGANYNEGYQVYDAVTDAYWTSLENNNIGNIPPATGAADTHWTPAVDMKRYIQLEQAWEVTGIDEDGVDVNAFAFYEDPLGNPSARVIQGCRRVEDCVMFPNVPNVPNVVWIKFKPVAPRYALELWSGATAYGAGELVYLTATRECYIATRPTTNENPTDTVEDGNPWAIVGFPDMFQDFVTLACKAENQSEDEGKYKTMVLAEDELDDLVHKKTAKAGEGSRVFVGRRR